MTDESTRVTEQPSATARWWLPRLSRSRFARDMTGTFAANLVSVTVGMAQSIVVARALGSNGKGIIAFGILLPSTAILLVDAGFTASSIYFASKSSPTKLMRNAITFIVCASAAVVLVLTALRVLTGTFDALPTAAFFVALALVPVLMAGANLRALLIGLGKVFYVNVVSIAQTCVTFVLVGVAVILDLGPTTILVGVGISALLGSLLLVRRLVLEGARPTLGCDLPLLAQQIRFGLRDHPGNLVQFMNYRLDQFIIAAYLGVSAVGIYSVAVAMAEVLWMVPQAAGVLIFARVARDDGNRMDLGTQVLLRWVVVLSVVGGLGLAIFGRWMITLLYSQSFLGAYDALLLLLPGAAALGPAKVLTSEIAGRGRPGLNSITAAIGAALTISLDFLLIPKYGIRGAAGASSLSYSLVAVMAWYWYQRLRRQPSAGANRTAV